MIILHRFIKQVINEATKQKSQNYDRAVILFNEYIKKFANDKYFLRVHDVMPEGVYILPYEWANEIDIDIVKATDDGLKHFLVSSVNNKIVVHDALYEFDNSMTIDRFASLLKVAKNYEEFVVLLRAMKNKNK